MSIKDYGQCLICGDTATGSNFGVRSCMPCKAFFRRNAVKLGKREFICEGDGDCDVTQKHRRSCNCCRLAKCFRVGMKKSLILTDEQRKARNQLVNINRLKRGKVPKKQCIKWMRAPSLLRMPSNSFQCLSPSDQLALAYIFNAYENTCMLAKRTRFSSFPLVIHTTFHELMNEISPLFQTFVEYFKYVPEFSSLIMDDKIRLIRNHFGTIMNINEPLLYFVTPSNLIVSWTNVFGVRLAEIFIKRSQIIEQYIVDPILLKLVAIILLLSSSFERNLNVFDMNLICVDSLKIYKAQNVYVELLWNYILSRSSTERDAVKYFNKLMMFLLFEQNLDLCIDAYLSNLHHAIDQVETILQSTWPKSNGEKDIKDMKN